MFSCIYTYVRCKETHYKTHLFVWENSFILLTHTGIMSWHVESFILHIWMFFSHTHKCTYSYVQYQWSHAYVCWTTHSYVQYDSCTCDSDTIFCIANMCSSHREQILSRLCVWKKLIHTCNMIGVCVTQTLSSIFHTCVLETQERCSHANVFAKTDSYVRQDSFKCDSDNVFCIVNICSSHTEQIFSRIHI